MPARPAVLAALVLGVLLWSAAPSLATTGPAYTSVVYADQLSNNGSPTGPIGVALDASGSLYVTNSSNDNLYRFPAGCTVPCHASSSLLQGFSSGSGTRGVAFGLDGKLYVALTGKFAIVEVDPASGTVVRTVTNQSTAQLQPLGLAVDPLTGDLFFSNGNSLSGYGIYRIAHPSSGTNLTAALYASTDTDGFTFAADGTIFATDFSTQVNNELSIISGTNGPPTPTVSPLGVNTSNGADGIALAANAAAPGRPAYLLVNTNGGVVNRVDLNWSTNPPSATLEPNTAVFYNGSRGDFATVGPDGCLYFTQLTTVRRLSNSDGTCSLSPSVSADLAVTNGASPSTVPAGTNVTYTIQVTNNGPNAAQATSLGDVLPSTESFVSCGTAVGTCAATGNSVQASLGTMNRGATATITVVATVGNGVAPGTLIDDTATASSVTDDTVPANNSGKATVTVGQASSADLSIGLSSSAGSVAADGLVTYTSTITNPAGASTATNVRVTTAAAQDIPIRATASQGSCAGSVCNLGTMPASSTATVKVTEEPIVPTGSTPQTVSAAVTSDTPDPNSANDSASVQTAVTAVAGTKYVSVADSGFAPATVAGASQGTIVQWDFFGPAAHTATDGSGMGLYDSGPMQPVSLLRYRFFCAGSFPVKSTGDAFTGRVTVPVAGPSSAPLDQVFQLTWADTTAPSGFAYDVQVEAPGATSFSPLFTGVTSNAGAVWETVAGTWRFRAQLRRVTGSDVTANWSPIKTVAIS